MTQSTSPTSRRTFLRAAAAAGLTSTPAPAERAMRRQNGSNLPAPGPSSVTLPLPNPLRAHPHPPAAPLESQGQDRAQAWRRRTQVGERLALLPHPPLARLLETDRRYGPLRSTLARCHAPRRR